MTQPYGSPETPNIPAQPQYQPAPQQSAYPAQPQPYQQPYQAPAPQPYGQPQYPTQQYPVQQYPVQQAPQGPMAYKDSTAAWLLWFFLGYFGAHQFYLGNNQRGTIYAVVCGLSMVLSLVFIGFIGFLVLFVFWIIDATQLSQKLNEYNARAYANNQALGIA